MTRRTRRRRYASSPPHEAFTCPNRNRPILKQRKSQPSTSARRPLHHPKKQENSAAVSPKHQIEEDPAAADPDAAPAALKAVDATCPLSGFDADAVEWSLPLKLRKLRELQQGVGAPEPAAEGSGKHHHGKHGKKRESKRDSKRSSKHDDNKHEGDGKKKKKQDHPDAAATPPSADDGGADDADAPENGGAASAAPTEAELGEPIDVVRVWATILSVASLHRLDECWRVSPDGAADETIIDRAMGWLKIQQARCPALDDVTISECLEEAMRFVVHSWKPAHAIAMKGAREEVVGGRLLRDLNQMSHVTRAAGRVVTAALLKHETVACFTVRSGGHEGSSHHLFPVVVSRSGNQQWPSASH